VLVVAAVVEQVVVGLVAVDGAVLFIGMLVLVVLT
jgi:hypothetical protein